MENDNVAKSADTLEKYYELASDWFGISCGTFVKSNFNTFVKIIENEYRKLDMEKAEYELFRLMTLIDTCPKENQIEISYYNLCINILNKSFNHKLYINSRDNLEAAIDSDEKSNNKGFLIKFWSSIFGALEKISVFSFVRKLTGNTSHAFVDGWVIGNLIASVLSSLLVYNLSNENRIIIYFITIYAILRVFEVIIYQINVLLFHPLKRKDYKIKSVSRMVTALLNSYVEIMFWYTTMVIAIVVLNNGIAYKLKWSNYIMSNILCIITLDSGSIKDAVHTSYTYFSDLIFLEIISGVIMTIMSLARFIGILPGVREIDAD